jgi:prepilin signal peptidase PulO-like enzyme (type II secretory pathway)
MIILAALSGLLIGAVQLYLMDVLPRFAAEPPETVPARPGWLMIVTPLASMAAAAALWARFGWSAEWVATVAAYAFFALIALIDLRYRLVLNVMTYPAMLVTLLAHALAGTALLDVVAGAIFALFIFLGAALTAGGLGMGDVKLATLMGLIFGFPGILWALIVGVGAGGVTAAVLIVRRYSLNSAMPYAPFLCLGALVALIYDPLTSMM